MAGRVTLAHGNGGRLSRELLEEWIAPALGTVLLPGRGDAAFLPWETSGLLVTCDGFTVTPLAFPGGQIGSLAVHGTVNDLAVAGAKPLFATLALLIEEGLPLETLATTMACLGQAAASCGLAIAAGDTKVVGKGQGGGLYLTLTGFGAPVWRPLPALTRIQPEDLLLVSGPVGDHGASVLLAREEFGFRGEVLSDSGPVLALVEAIREVAGVRFLRDPTRGGLATVSWEVAHGASLTVRLNDAAIPVRETVRSVCGMLGYDPLYLACEGRVVAVTAPESAREVLDRWRALPEGREAAIIGRVVRGPARTLVETPLGGERLLPELEEDPLPRIC